METITFVQFLKDNKVYDKYMENFKVEKQEWEHPALFHDSVEDFIDKNYHLFWVYMAFDWDKCPENFDFWEDIHTKWINESADKNVSWE